MVLQIVCEGRICPFCDCLAIHEVTTFCGMEKTRCKNCGTTDWKPIETHRAAA